MEKSIDVGENALTATTATPTRNTGLGFRAMTFHDAISKERDIELERATHYRDKWQSAEERIKQLEEDLMDVKNKHAVGVDSFLATNPNEGSQAVSDTPIMDAVDAKCDELGVMDAICYAVCEGQKLELALNEANDRIKRLEAAGDDCASLLDAIRPNTAASERWCLAKEAKP